MRSDESTSAVTKEPGNGSPATSEQTGKDSAAAPDLSAELAALKEELAGLKDELGEKDAAIEHWHKEATKGKPAPKTEEPEEEVDLIELASKGPKAFNTYLAKWAKKNGYVSADEVDKRFDSATSALAFQSHLVRQYPALNENGRSFNQEFFDETSKQYGKIKTELVKQGMTPAVADLVAMERAAEKTELAWLRSGKKKTSAQEEAERQLNRRNRAEAAGGDKGTRASATEEEEDDTFGKEEEAAVDLMMMGGLRDDKGHFITREKATEMYKARSKAGVNVGWRNARGGR